jgi:hypothetical protein
MLSTCADNQLAKSQLQYYRLFRLNCRVRYLREVAILLIFRISFIGPYSDRSAFIGSMRAALRAGT